MTIIDHIRSEVEPGMVIPKPEAKGEFRVKGWGKRRGEAALVYQIPNHKNPISPGEKGITESEFLKAHDELRRTGELTRAWFDKELADCAKEGSCNFTTLGGIFQMLGDATYAEQGRYEAL